MFYALEANGLGKRYGRQWALQDCTFQVPVGRVIGLVGLNGAGKTTLLHLAMGLIEPSSGNIRVFGEVPSLSSTKILTRVGFVAQERPLYRSFTVKEMLTFGDKLNPGWDDGLAREFLGRLKIPLTRRVGKLSGGQQALVALIMALAKRPELLLLDEPFANVDPLARREFMKILMETVAQHQTTILVSSHIVVDLENICDHLIILSNAHVQVACDIESLLRTHKLLIGPREHYAEIARKHKVLQADHAERQSNLLVQIESPIYDPAWHVQDVALEDVILAYLALQAINTPGSVFSSFSKQEVLK